MIDITEKNELLHCNKFPIELLMLFKDLINSYAVVAIVQVAISQYLVKQNAKLLQVRLFPILS